MSKITFYGGVGFATGSNFLFESSLGNKFLVDCGLFQGGELAHDLNREDFAYDPKSVSALFVTHAHTDHIGRIPKLVRSGFRGDIFSTPETKMISEIMFDDTLKILDEEARRGGVLPLYDKKDVETALSLWKEIPYHEKIKISNDLEVYLKDAGHILGSSIIEIFENGKKVVFTGDLGNSPSPLLKDTEFVTDADYLIMESVYGDRNHESKEERKDKLKEAVLGVVRKGGDLIIPTFSLERSQVILYELNNLIEDGHVPSIPVFLDSPLAIKLTGIYKQMKQDFNQAVLKEIKEGDDIFNFPKLKFIENHSDSEHIHLKSGPKIIMAGGGMSQGGRIIAHEKRALPHSRNTILFVGYQAAGTLGRKIIEGSKEVVIGNERVAINAEILSISGFSSHKDSDHLLEFVEKTAGTVKKVFVVMGEPKSSLFLIQKIKDNLGVDAILPEKGKSYILN